MMHITDPGLAIVRHPPKVLIFGSCVSRDIFNIPSEHGFELLDYFARSSLAVLASRPCPVDYPLDQIDSVFQRRMVERDLGRHLLARLAKADFDIFLIDLIDERFALCEIAEDCFATVSNEFVKANMPCFTRQEARRVASGSEEFKALWLKGAHALFSLLQEHGLSHKVYINCVYWADRLEDGSTPPSFAPKLIQAANELLEWMYGQLGRYLAPHQFLHFERAQLLGAPNHVWGLSPFHYVDGYYREAIARLSALPVVPAQSAAQAWQLFNSNHPELVTGAAAVAALSPAEVDARLTGEVDEIYAGDAAWRARFDPAQGAAIDALLARIKGGPELRDALLLQACELGRLELPSLSGAAAPARCTQSVFVQNRNFLCFRDEGEIFYLVQHQKFTRAIYFPLRAIVIVVDVIALPKSAIYTLQRTLAAAFPRYLQNMRRAPQARFAGLIATYPRPYHFFYDTLPVVFHIHRHVIPVSRLPAVIQFESGAFIPIGEFLGAPDKQRILPDEAALNADLLQDNGFCIQLGYSTRRDPDFDELDAELIQFATRKTAADPFFSQPLQQAKACHPLVWFGICTEKRSWQEQVDAIAQIINGLSARYPTLGVVFDGITSTCVQERESTRAALAVNEQAVVSRIRARLERPVAQFDLIGAQSAIKIAFAAQVSSFLTSFLTDSMYVARVARKPGLAHGARRAMHADHYHPATYFVPRDWVSDRSPPEANWSTVSYSLAPAAVARLFELVMSHSRRAPADLSLSCPKGEVTLKKLASGYEVHMHADERPQYLSVNGSDLRFDAQAADSVAIAGGAALDFYFRGRAEGEVSANLTVIAHNGSARCFTENVRLGDFKHIVFPAEATSYRLFVRLKGRGRLRIDRIEALRHEPDAAAAAAGASAPGLPADGAGIDLARWDRPVFEYASLPAFLADQPPCPGGLHRIALGTRWLELNFYPSPEPDLVIFFNGNLSRTKNTRLPAFSGMGALGRLKASILMLNDPSLYDSDQLSLGWYGGADGLPLQQLLPPILQRFAATHGSRRTILYGGSGGGFAAMHYAAAVKDAIAVVCNPQTDLTRYNRESVERYVDACLGGNPQALPLDQFFAAKGIGHQAAPAFLAGNYKLVYLQNKLDQHHWQQHFLPFLEQAGLARPGTGLCQTLGRRASAVLSDEWGVGHSAAPREFIYGLLELLLSDVGEADWAAALAALHASSALVLKTCALHVEDGVFASQVILADTFDASQLKLAWYLYRDGQRIESKPYGAERAVRFETPAQPGIYWAVVFARAGAIRQSMRSNKNYGI